MNFDDYVHDFECRMGVRRSEVSPALLDFTQAKLELEEATGEACPPFHYLPDRNWQLSFWRHWFWQLRDIEPKAVAVCIRQIQRLRGRSV